MAGIRSVLEQPKCVYYLQQGRQTYGPWAVLGPLDDFASVRITERHELHFHKSSAIPIQSTGGRAVWVSASHRVAVRNTQRSTAVQAVALA